jgi:hypothetical protein
MKIEKGIGPNEIAKMLDYSYKFFNKIISKENFDEHVLSVTNFPLSARLITDTGMVKGIYLIGTNKLSNYVVLPELDGLIGVEGVLLAIDEDIRGMGFGNKLKDYPKSIGVDYIWGQQFKALNNLEDWLKRRVLVHETENVYITMEKY